MKPILTESDLVEVTGKERPSAQVRCFNEWGVAFRIRTDGTILTTWEAINAALMSSQKTRPNLQAARKAG